MPNLCLLAENRVFSEIKIIALSFDKIGGVSAMDKKISKLFFCHCAQLALSLCRTIKTLQINKK